MHLYELIPKVFLINPKKYSENPTGFTHKIEKRENLSSWVCTKLRIQRPQKEKKQEAQYKLSKKKKKATFLVFNFAGSLKCSIIFAESTEPR